MTRQLSHFCARGPKLAISFLKYLFLTAPSKALNRTYQIKCGRFRIKSIFVGTDLQGSMASPTNKGGRNTGSGTNGNINEKGAGSIDRETKCPLLLRVFCATSRHNSLSDYNKGKNV